MTDHKHTYFQLRSNVAKSQPEQMAEREIQTLRTLEGIIGHTLLCADGVAVDAGCGSRYLQPALEQLGMAYIGYDITDLDLEKDSFSQSDESVDVVLNYAVMEHLKDPSNFLSESLRCLKPGGALVVTTPNWHHSMKNFYNDYTHVKPYTPGSLCKLLSDFGFAEIYDFPNLRCKSPTSYTNRWKYFLAAHRPFTGGAPGFIPSFLTGRAKGIMAIAIKGQG